MDDDAGVLARLRARDPETQAQVWRELHPRLSALCTRIVGDPARGEEVAQDVWIDFAYTYVDRVEKPGAMRGYLIMMAVRRARRQAIRRRQHRREGEPEERASEHQEAPLVEALHHDRLKARLTTCLEELRPRARQMLRMRFREELSLREIGEGFGVSKQAVGKAVRVALAALRACIERLGEEATR